MPLLVEHHDPEPTPAFAIFPPGTQKIPKVRVFSIFSSSASAAAPGSRALGDFEPCAFAG